MAGYEPPGETEGNELRSIDEAASPSSQNSPEDPGKPIPPLDTANYGGINSLVNVGMDGQVPGSTCTYISNSFNDDVAQYRKGGRPTDPHLVELNRVRNQAFNAVGETQDNTNVPLTGLQDSDPKGG